MGKDSNIEWTDNTFNPWWGCIKVSPGCENCYAETFSNRFGGDIWGSPKTTKRRLFGDKHWAEPIKWDYDAKKTGIKTKVFCASMCDVFEDHPMVEVERIRLWNLIRSTPNLIWQLLTKRPENIMSMVPAQWKERLPENIWIGTSVEDQKRADERIPHLLKVPAVVRFLSCEPLLEKIELKKFLPRDQSMYEFYYLRQHGFAWGVSWVIVGGESGQGKRPFNSDWARSIRKECEDSGVAFFMKQIDKIQPIPEDLLIRQFPK